MVNKILLIFSTIKSISGIFKEIPNTVNTIKKIINIIKGWYFKIFKKKQDIAKKRLTICNKCDNKVKSALGDVCSQCGCVLDAKTRVQDEQCEMNKW